jgi:hypothetical protein
VVTNKNLFENNSELHEHKTRLCKNLHLPAVNVDKLDKGVHITGIRVFNQLLDSVKRLVNDEKNFKSTLEGFLYHHSIYSMTEFYQYTES